MIIQIFFNDSSDPQKEIGEVFKNSSIFFNDRGLNFSIQKNIVFPQRTKLSIQEQIKLNDNSAAFKIGGDYTLSPKVINLVMLCSEKATFDDLLEKILDRKETWVGSRFQNNVFDLVAAILEENILLPTSAWDEF